jgi:hypothetical protein
MKSAYELAMERLNKSTPSRPLSDAQKAEIADLESLYKSRVAQLELSLKDEVAAAEASGDPALADEFRERFRSEKARLESERDAKKERVRDQR